MFRFTRKGQLASGALVPKAIGWATEFNSYVNDNFDIELHFGLEMFGSNHMVWYFDADSLADIEAVNKATLSDPKYWEFVDQASDFWVDGSMEDTVVALMG